MKRLSQDHAYVDSVLIDGGERANVIAEQTIKDVKDIVGFIRKR
jgi:tryptophanyl-tRNA synthetase